MNVQKVENIKNASEFELKHVPKIEVPEEYQLNEEIEVKITVGEIMHVMTAEHYIKWIELYKNGELVDHVDLSPSDKPIAVFKINLDGSDRLMAREECNLHGLWESEKVV